MRAECYVLDIYCDNRVCDGVTCDGTREQYTGRNQREARAKARSDNWIIGKRDYCSKSCALQRQEKT